MAMLCLEHTYGSFVVRFFTFLWPAGPGEVSGEGLHGILMSFSDMSFNTLIHQNVRVEGSGIIFWLVLSSKNLNKDVIEEGWTPWLPFCPGMVWDV